MTATDPKVADGLQTAFALAIDREYFHMAGGVPEMNHVVEAGPGEMQLAWAVLNTPEMQAIRGYLRLLAWQLGPAFSRVGRPDDPGSSVDLPSSVVEWVAEGS